MSLAKGRQRPSPRQSTPVSGALRIVGLMLVLPALVGGLAAFFHQAFTPRVDVWNAATVASHLAAVRDLGCQRGSLDPERIREPSGGPLHAEIIDITRDPPSVCLTLAGDPFEPPAIPFLRNVGDQGSAHSLVGGQMRTVALVRLRSDAVLAVAVQNPAAGQRPSGWVPLSIGVFLASAAAGLMAVFTSHPAARGVPSRPSPESPAADRHANSPAAGGHRDPPSAPASIGGHPSGLSDVVGAPSGPVAAARPSATAGAGRRKRIWPVQLAASTTSGVSGLTVDRGRSGDLEVYAATQVGLQHARYGQPREDAYAIGGDPQRGLVFVAVADGLGSSINAHAASRTASRSAVERMQELVSGGVDILQSSPVTWDRIARDIITDVSRQMAPSALDRVAQEIGFRSPPVESAIKTSDLPSCTLTLAAINSMSAWETRVCWAAVGDCELLYLDLDNGALHWATRNEAKSGNQISNVTASLPRDPDLVMSGSDLLPANRMVLLASDGVADAIRLIPEQFAVLLRRCAGGSPAEHIFGELVAFDLPGLHDDRTLVAAWPSNSGPP